jgi:hypothetical protein
MSASVGSKLFRSDISVPPASLMAARFPHALPSS